MDLPLLSGGTPDTKPWCNIVVNSITSNTSINKYSVVAKVPNEKLGAGNLNLTVEQFVNGVTIWDVASTGNLVCPSSASIDAFLDIKDDGWTIQHTVINRNALGDQLLIPPDAAPQNPVPNSQVGKPHVTAFYFTRLSGNWLCVNS